MVIFGDVFLLIPNIAQLSFARKKTERQIDKQFELNWKKKKGKKKKEKREKGKTKREKGKWKKKKNEKKIKRKQKKK